MQRNNNAVKKMHEEINEREQKYECRGGGVNSITGDAAIKRN